MDDEDCWYHKLETAVVDRPVGRVCWVGLMESLRIIETEMFSRPFDIRV